MHFTHLDIAEWDRVFRLKVINSVTGIKPANLIGTVDSTGISNLAVFSSVVHLGSNPPLLGLIARPRTKEVGHTLQNILATGSYTINHIHPEFTEQAHYTSIKFDESISEFAECGLNEEYIDGHPAPFVKESKFKLGMKFTKVIDLPNETQFVIGEIVHIILPDVELNNGDLDLEITQSVGISGLNSYYKLNKVAQYPFARTAELPNFKSTVKKT